MECQFPLLSYKGKGKDLILKECQFSVYQIKEKGKSLSESSVSSVPLYHIKENKKF
jgi:hypothetical protein